MHPHLTTKQYLGVLAGRQSGSSEVSERLPAPVFSDSPSPVPRGPHGRRISVLEADDISDDITSPILESSDLRSAVAAAQARETHEIATGEASVHQTPEQPADVAAKHAAPDVTQQASIHQAGSPKSGSKQATECTAEHAAAAAAAGRVTSVAGGADHSGSSAAGDEAATASNPVNEMPPADSAGSDRAEAQPESAGELAPGKLLATDVSEDTQADGVQEAQPAKASQPIEEGASVGTGSAEAQRASCTRRRARQRGQWRQIAEHCRAKEQLHPALACTSSACRGCKGNSCHDCGAFSRSAHRACRKDSQHGCSSVTLPHPGQPPAATRRPGEP